MADFDGNITLDGDVESIPLPAGFIPRVASLSVEDADVRLRLTGNDPVGGDGGGHLITNGTVVTVKGRNNIEAVRLVRDTSTTAQVFYTLEK